ncbi:MAG: metal-binding protein [Phormidesmis sp.]
MPSGRTHDKITLWCLPAVVGLTAWAMRSPTIVLTVSVAYLVGGFMLGPDLDIVSIQYKRWGPLRWIWLPYQTALPHRSRFSHGPIIGTALRVVYLAIWTALFTMVAVTILNAVWDAQLTWQSLGRTLHYLAGRYFAEWVAILVGLEVGAMSHSISDVTGSYLVRKRSGRIKASKKKRVKRKKENRRKGR